MDNIDTEVRFSDTKIRMLRVYGDGGGRVTIHMTWDKTTYKTYPQLVEEWGLRQVVLHGAANERWHHDLTLADARRRVARWRQSAEKAGLTTVRQMNMWR